jgi:hypothetical protein
MRLSIEKTKSLIRSATPTCVEMLRFYQGRGGWISLPPAVALIRSNLRIENYVELYDDYKKIGVCVLLAFMEPEVLRDWNDELAALPPEKHDEALSGLSKEIESLDELLDGVFDLPESEKDIARAKAEFDALPLETQRETIRFLAFLWSAMLAGFHDTLSIMVHGERLTSLVPKAIAGDDEAFCKAIQIDRQLYTHHPAFRRRIDTAHFANDEAFLRNVSYRLRAKTSHGRIRYPGLWTVLSILDIFGWLDGSLTAEQILDICDEAGLHRFENRIEDANALNKSLRLYRKMQKTALLSSH